MNKALVLEVLQLTSKSQLVVQKAASYVFGGEARWGRAGSWPKMPMMHVPIGDSREDAIRRLIGCRVSANNDASFLWPHIFWWAVTPPEIL